jgi:hypothetical protein
VGAQVSAAKWRRRREGLGDSTVRWRGGPAGGNSRKLVASGRAGDQHTWGGGPVQAWAASTGTGHRGSGTGVGRGRRLWSSCFGLAQKVIVLFFIYSKTLQTDLNRFDQMMAFPWSENVK